MLISGVHPRFANGSFTCHEIRVVVIVRNVLDPSVVFSSSRKSARLPVEPPLDIRAFVVRVLGNEFTLDGKGKNGLAEVGGLDGIGVVEEEV